MIRNEIGCYNRWGRFAFRWKTYRGMHHWIRTLKDSDAWDGIGLEISRGILWRKASSKHRDVC